MNSSAPSVSPLRKLAIRVYQNVSFLPRLYRPIRNRVVLASAKRRAAASRKAGTACHLVVGANHKFQEGWIGLERYTLDVTVAEDWARIFEPNSLDTVLAEHVWEHLPPEQAQAATALCFRYLRPGGRLRLAVPDGHFPDSEYIEFVRPGGNGPGAWDHHELYTRTSLGRLMEGAGFGIEPLEHFDEQGQFHAVDWSADDGYIRRSTRFYRDFQFGEHFYTSLILDGIKPIEPESE